MSKISNYILKIRNKLSKKENEFIPRLSVNYRDAKHIGILFNLQSEDRFSVLHNFIQTLQKDKKYLNILTYSEKFAENIYPFECDIITGKDVSALGQIKSAPMEKFIHCRFDYLYCVSTKPFPLFDAILKKSQAKCRVGKYFQRTENHLDLMIALSENQNEEALIKEMLSYTKILTKNEN